MGEPIIICIDIGFGYTKILVLYPDGTTVDIAVLPSAYGPVGRDLYNGRDRHRLNLWGTTYYYGEDALRFCRSPITSRDRNREPEMIETLFLGAVSETGLFSGTCQVYTSLPVEWLPDAEKLRVLLTGKHAAHRVDLKRDICLHVQGNQDTTNLLSQSGVSIYPQPMMVFLRRASDKPALWEEWSSVLVIDIGTGTFNQSLILGGEWVDERSTSKPNGMGMVLERALQDQEAKTGRRDLLTVARAKLWHKDKEMAALCEPHVESLIDDVMQTAADVAGNISITEVVLSGGGALFCVAEIKRRFDTTPVHVYDDSELDVVKGLLVAAHNRP